jgi:Ca-activated chloride channel family protein
MYRRKRIIALTLIVLSLSTIMCTCGSPGTTSPPRNATVIDVVANTGLAPWMEETVEQFNKAKLETSGGNPVFVRLSLVESGQAVTNIAGGGASPALWIPDDAVWSNLLADREVGGFQGDCVSVAESPLVIAMWKPVAESLGWPGRSLGWLDVGSLAADPSAWAYYSGGQFGDTLRLGHTHPGLSSTGSSTLLAIVQAAESKEEAVNVDDIQRPIVQASVSAFEAAVSWFSSSTDNLGQVMSERGVDFLGAAVMYESTVVSYGDGDPAIVPIYPFEGTFVATHPACLNGSLDAEAQESARIFRDYLLGEEAQQLAVSHGLRPVNTAVPVGAPLDKTRGVDLDQPKVAFGSPTVDTIYAVQDLWQEARKDVNLVMLLDTSGSMGGSKIDSARSAAIQFVEQMGSDDYISVIAFSDSPRTVVRYQQVGPHREQIKQAIAALWADGDTSLYDAIGDGAALIADTHSSQMTNALVVLSDGMDTNSSRFGFNQALFDAAAANDTTVFTIGYGRDADKKLLSELALEANGNFYLGDEASIAAIYEEMSAAFGGSAGIGR